MQASIGIIPIPAPAAEGNEPIANGVDEGFAEEEVEAEVPLVQDDVHEEQPEAEGREEPAAAVEEVAPGGFGFVLGGGLGAAHQALLLRDSPTEFHPYHCPKWFHFKVSHQKSSST